MSTKCRVCMIRIAWFAFNKRNAGCSVLLVRPQYRESWWQILANKQLAEGSSATCDSLTLPTTAAAHQVTMSLQAFISILSVCLATHLNSAGLHFGAGRPARNQQNVQTYGWAI